MNPETLERYQSNVLRVVPELSYSPHATDGSQSGTSYNPRLDLVLFVNGIPTATLELKSQFKQTIDHAKRQYCQDRPVRSPLSRKPEPLLTFKRGALVHFAVTQQEVAMTTRLAGKQTYFLPFNLGTEEGGAGNPKSKDPQEYVTAYLWKGVFNPDAWLKVVGRFLHLEKKTSEDPSGKTTTREILIFPRYHQWDVVNKLIAATKEEGVGKRYLVQHSAGSGKSNSIAWTAHQLAALYDDQGQKLFDSVVVITDRTVLDRQLQDTIYQFDHAQGVVHCITDLGGSKSGQLAEALKQNARIIIVTIQTFPALYDALDNYPELRAGRYAVIADEAHSSQTGSSASKLKSILSSERTEGDPEELSAEELLQAAVAARMPTDRISYYAFTATPKAKTIELFGRTPDPDLPPGKTNKPEAFHLYSMRQAIEEGFILDVLKNYMTYKTAWKIANADGEINSDDEVDSKKAHRKLARWVRLHPYNISQKVEIIIEHFRAKIRHLLGGQAKAMVVTSSRQEAVRYQLALQEYIQNMQYKDVYSLVAFSGRVPADEVISEEVSETSKWLNPGLDGRDIATAFDTQEFNVLIAANKFQTGFDQPKLCAMYVDKKLAGVDCVQTLSRLNRTFGQNKETFILDFFNDPQDILQAFLPYYNKAELVDVTDQQLVYDLRHNLDEAQIYHQHEVEAFALAFFDPKASNAQLSYHSKPARDRYALRYQHALEAKRSAVAFKKKAEGHDDAAGLKRANHALEEAEKLVDELELFKKNLLSFVRLYEFMSQVIAYDDVDLEKLCVFARHLHPLLRADRLEEDVDVGELQLTHYRLTKQAEQQLVLEGHAEYDSELKPASEVGSGQPRSADKRKLSEIIAALNEIFGAEIDDDDQVDFLMGVTRRISRQDDVMSQLRSHSLEQAMLGLLPKRVEDSVLDVMDISEKLSLEVLENEAKSKAFTLAVAKVLKEMSESSELE